MQENKSFSGLNSRFEVVFFWESWAWSACWQLPLGKLGALVPKALVDQKIAFEILPNGGAFGRLGVRIPEGVEYLIFSVIQPIRLFIVMEQSISSMESVNILQLTLD